MKYQELIEILDIKRKMLVEKMSNEFLLKIGIGISVMVLFIVSFLSFDTMRLLINNANWVDHTNAIIQKIDNVIIIFKDAQLDRREYLVTRDEKSLKDYFSTQEMINSELKIIKLLTEDNPSQQNNIAIVQKMFDENFHTWDTLIKSKANIYDIYNQKEIPTKATLINSKLRAMRFDELNLLHIRLGKFDTSKSESPPFLIFLACTALGFIVLFYFILNSTIIRLRKISMEKQEAYEASHAINEELTATSEELKQSLDKINSFKTDLEITKARLEEAQAIANMGNWEWDIVSNTIYWSDQLIKIFEYNPEANEKFDYQTYLELLHPDDKERLNDAVQKVLKDHSPYFIEHRIFTKDGRIKWLMSKGKVTLSDNGEVSKLVGTVIDITDLKAAQTEEEKLVAVVENSSDFIGLGDNEGNIVFINNAGKKLVGLNMMSRDLKTHILDYFMEEDLPFVKDHVLPTVFEKGKWSGEINFKNFYTEKPVPVCWNVFLVNDKVNDRIGIAHIVQDLSPEKKIRQELQVKNEELYSAVEELRQAEENLMLMNRELEVRVEERGKELVVSEERFRLVSLATNDAIWDWDLQTDNLWWNEGFKTMFGYLNEHIEPNIESLHSRIHPDDKFRVLRDIRLFLASGDTQWNAEYRFLNSEGLYIHVMDRGYVIHNELGKPYRMLGSLINITERKELESQRMRLHEIAEEQRKRLYELLMNIPAAITILKGRDLTYQMVNTCYKTMFGIEGNLIGKSRKKLSPFANSDEMLKILTEVFNTGIAFSINEYKSEVKRNHSLETAYFNILIEPIYDDENNIDGLMTFAVEVTDQVVARQNIEESAEKLRLMFEAIPQMAWKSDPDGTPTYYNAKWYEYTGSNFEELQNDWYKFLHPEDKEKAKNMWYESIVSGETYELEYRWLRASDKTYRWMLGRAMPVKNSMGKIIMWVGSCTDIHDQKLIYSDLDKKNQELIKVNELLDTFVYTAAHDLKSPVINLKSLFELIKETEDSDKKQQYFNTIDVAVNRLDDTITGLVEVIEVQSEDNKIAKEILFDEVLSTVLEDFSPALSNVNGRIQSDFKSCMSIYYLKSYVNSILTNLIGNAIKYRNHEIPLLIDVSSYRDDKFVVLVFKDNGIGIDLVKNGNKIFKAFNRFTRTAQGKGLGLYLIKTMVERNGGHLEIESQLNVGTSFKIYLKEYI